MNTPQQSARKESARQESARRSPAAQAQTNPDARWTKYAPAPQVSLPDRRWPDRRIEAAPIWLSTDLRDGNQALFDPMDSARKMKLWNTLLRVGYREIEIGFPAASQTDFDFCRKLIEEDRIPHNVTIQVMTQARDDLIDRSFEALRGAPRAIVHVYNATAPLWRRVVFNASKDEVRGIAEHATRRIRDNAERFPGTHWQFQYSPEIFMSTELEFSLEVCDAVTKIWDARPERKVILNLPTTVEVSTPNIFADQIEWMDRHLARRDGIVLSIHPHNDRGTATATAELALMAGAERVEGCLFGNGERTGNVDLVTLALNLHTQGIDPEVDFSDINAVARVAEDCTQLPIHPRHPYVGDLVFTAFSGSHQDAIRKGFAAQDGTRWAVPYLPIDPVDVGRTYDSIVRVNSQSGKGGIAYLLETQYGVSMSRRMQVEFSAAVQHHMDAEGGEFSAAALWSLYEAEYLHRDSPWRHVSHRLVQQANESCAIEWTIEHRGRQRTLQGSGRGPVDAAVHALAEATGAQFRLDDYREQSLSTGADAAALAQIELARNGQASTFGAGTAQDIVGAALSALTSALNRIDARDARDARQACDARDGHDDAGQNRASPPVAKSIAPATL